ncbi:MAG: LysM peptidoglycan-binding domain-containing protein [Clostridium sp.]|jgi:hypothetical protein|nr:LysM peptidoglycan-binding domain-containing protein [Clostridium sp.]
MKVPCPVGTTSYRIQAGDTLYKIAGRFNTTVQQILLVNPGINPNMLYIGQEICIPVQSATTAVAEITRIPVFVNGANINTGTYPVLNYKPPQAQYPYIYVPIAEFSRIGARVIWNEYSQAITVISNDYELRRQMDVISQALGKLIYDNNAYMDSTEYDNFMISFEYNLFSHAKSLKITPAWDTRVAQPKFGTGSKKEAHCLVYTGGTLFPPDTEEDLWDTVYVFLYSYSDLKYYLFTSRRPLKL